MQPTKQLPDSYQPANTIDLTQNQRLVLGLNVAALALLVLSGLAFTSFSKWLRPDYWAEGGKGILNGLGIVSALLSLVFMVLLHEGVHGLFFFVFTRELPAFGLNLMYAFAAAPDWYLPRRQYTVVGLAPFVLITAVGLAQIPFIPGVLLPALLFTLSLNAGGAVGDLYIVWKVTQSPARTLINDQGASLTLFTPTESN